MYAAQDHDTNRALLRAIRRCVEYAVTVGLALLSSYWIVYGHW